MSELSFWPAVAAATAEPRFLIALAVALLAGLVRGFTGFGSALIYMPLMSAVYSPQVAAPTLLLFDTFCSLPFALKVWTQATRREIVPAAFGGAVFVPLGVAALIYVDILILRWFIAALVLIALAVLISGWRYQARPTPAISFGVGAMAGFGAGSVQIAAPPLLVFWLGGQNSAATVRANIMVYFIIEGSLSILAYLFTGLFDRQVVTLALLLGVPFAAAMTVGAYFFHGTSDRLYRRIAYVIIAISGLVSLPLFDALR